MTNEHTCKPQVLQKTANCCLMCAIGKFPETTIFSLTGYVLLGPAIFRRFRARGT